MKLGYVYRSVLKLSHQEALYTAAEWLDDHILIDLRAMSDGSWDAQHSVIVDLLPQRYMLRYRPQFMRRFHACLLTVIWKLGQRERISLSCVAEELAAYALIQEARGVLEETGERADFGAFEEELFEDLDFEMLYDDAYDGIEDPEHSEELGTANLAFADWFTRFGSSDNGTYPEPHPLAWDNKAASTDEPDENNELDEGDDED